MSTGAVDTKTAELRFDVDDFEKNSKQVLSTLDKLKRAFKFDGASSGLEEIEKASRKLDFRDFKGSIDSVGKRFGVLETIATGALLKIGASAAEAGMRIAKSLTIDQIAAGWDKYAEKTTAVQTIMANLREDEGDFIDEASKMEYVNGYLEKLMWFSDETSYSFTDMTSNVGKFIANGQGLSESVTAMQGIATWAAVSGQNTQVAARAMYNISQAMGTGSMKIRDWMSIENANMATAQFKELAITIGQKQKKIKEGQVTVENFRESLSGKDTNGWFDKNVMMEVFATYGEASDKIQAYLAENPGKTATEIIRDIRNGNEQIAREVGITADSIGFKALQAAQEAKTFQEVVKATADAVSTKWSRIFESIFGNYLQAKELWTDLSNDLWNIFAGPLDRVAEIMDTWNKGFFKDGPQNIIQKWFESGKLDDLENGLGYITDSVAELAVKSDKATFSIETLEDGSRQLVKLVQTAPGVYTRFVKKIYDADKDLLSGRDLLIGGFRNILRTLIFDWEDADTKTKHLSIFGALKAGLSEVIFGTSDMDEVIPKASKKIWELTKNFNDLTEKMKPSDETINKIKNSFKGLFTGFKIGGKLFAPVIDQFKKLFGIGTGFKKGKRSILDLANSMSTWIQELDKWLDENKVFQTVSNKVSGWFTNIKTGVDNLSISLTGLTVKDYSKKIADKVFGFFGDFDFQKLFGSISGFFTGIGDQIRQVVNDDLPEELSPLQKFLVGTKKVFGGIKKFFLGIIPTFRTFGGKVKNVFTFITGSFKSLVTQIKQVAKGDLPEELTPLQKFLVGVGTVFGFFKKSYEKLITTFPKFIQRIRSFKLSDLKGLLVPIQNLWQSSKTFVESVIKGELGSKAPASMSKAETRLAPIIKAFSSIFEGLGHLLESAGPYIEKIGQGIGEFLTTIGDGLGKLVGDKSGLEILADIIKLFKDFSVARFINSVARLDNRFSKLVKVFTKQTPKTLESLRTSISEFFGGTKTGISGFFDSLLKYITGRKTVGKAVVEDLEAVRDIFKSYRRQINAEALIDFALAIGILAGSLLLVAQVPPERLVSVGKAIGQLAVVVAGLYAVGKLFAGLEAYLSKKAGANPGNSLVEGIKDILTSTVKSSIFANDATAKFLKFALGVALIAIAVKKISSSMNEISEGIITIGKAYANPKFKDGLKALGILAAGLAITSLVSSLGGSHVLSTITTFVTFLLFIKKAKKLVEQISDIGSSTDGVSFYKGLEYVGWLLTGIAAISLISSVGGVGTKIVGFIGSILLVLSLTRFVRILAESLSNLAKGTSPRKMTAAAEAIKSIANTLMIFTGVLSLISSTRKGRKAVTRAILAFLAGALAIRLIASSLIKLAKDSDSNKINAAAELIKNIGKAVFISLGVLTALSGLSFKGKTVSYNGKTMWAVAVALIAFFVGIKMILNSIKDIADSGKTDDVTKVVNVLQSLLDTIGIWTGVLTIISGLVGHGGAVNFIGPAGILLAAASFLGICYGIKLIAGALSSLANAGNIEDIEKAGDILYSLTDLIGFSIGILGAEGSLAIFTGAVNAIPALGMLAAAGSFAIICDGLVSIAEALTKIANHGNIEDIEKAGDVLKSLTNKLAIIIALLGAEGGLAAFTGVVNWIPALGMLAAANSFSTICDGLVSIAEALTSVAKGANVNDIEKAGEVLESMATSTGWITALVGTATSLFGKGNATEGANALKTTTTGIQNLAAAIKELSAIDYRNFSAQALDDLERVIRATSEIFAISIGDAFISSSTMTEKANAFNSVIGSVESIMNTLSGLSNAENASGADNAVANLDKIITSATKIFESGFWDNFKPDEYQAKADAFATVAGPITEILKSMTEFSDLSALDGLDKGSGEALGSYVKSFADSVINNYVSGLNDGQQNVYDAAVALTTKVQDPMVSIIGDASQWGEDLAYNFASGIRAGGDAYVPLAATYVANIVHSILGFSEPDEGPLSDFHTYAPDMIKLWCKGIKDNLGLVKDSSYGVADTVYDGFSTALDYVSGLIDNGMSDQLTIRPVMDLSEIQNGMNSMNSMLSSNNGYAIAGTTRLAAMAAYGAGNKPEMQKVPGTEPVESGPINNTFYISNNDPNVVAEKVSKIISGQVRREKAVWAR